MTSQADNEEWFKAQSQQLMEASRRRGITVRDLARFLAVEVAWLIHTNIHRANRTEAVQAFAQTVMDAVEISAQVEPMKGMMDS